MVSKFKLSKKERFFYLKNQKKEILTSNDGM